MPITNGQLGFYSHFRQYAMFEKNRMEIIISISEQFKFVSCTTNCIYLPNPYREIRCILLGNKNAGKQFELPHFLLACVAKV